METSKVVYIVYDHGDGNISKVFDNEAAAKAWVKKGHEEGWLYDEDCSIWEETVHSDIS